MTGRIKTVNEAKQYAFIAADDGNSYFMHRSCLKSIEDWPYIEVHKAVQFTPTNTPKGYRAEGVSLL